MNNSTSVARKQIPVSQTNLYITYSTINASELIQFEDDEDVGDDEVRVYVSFLPRVNEKVLLRYDHPSIPL